MGTKTSWTYAQHPANSAYLCTDGTRLQAPLLETTPARRRWRIAGTKQSCSYDDLEQLLIAAMHAEASRQGKMLWVREWTEHALWTRHNVIAGLPASWNLGRTPPTLDSALAFEFQAPDLPQLQAVIWLYLRSDADSNRPYNVTSLLTYHAPPTAAIGQFQPMVEKYTGWGKLTPTNEIPFKGTTHKTLRQALSCYLTIARAASGIDTLRVLDGRTGKPAEVRFVRTNFTEEHYREVLTRFDADETLTRLNQHLDGVVAELRNLGIVVAERVTRQAMETAPLANFPCWVKLEPDDNPENFPNGHRDQVHAVTLDLLHGVMFVDCSTDAALRGGLDAWEVARFKAGISGEEDILLAYARAWDEPARRAILRRAIADKAAPPPPASGDARSTARVT